MDNETGNTPPAEGFVPIEQVAGVVKEAGAGDRKPTAREAFRKDVASILAGSGPTVRGMVITHYVDAEQEKRKKAVISIIEKIDAKNKELQKGLKAGSVVFGPDEKPLPPTFTKEQLEANKKLREEISKFEGALSKALESNDWQKLFELTGGDKGSSSPQS